MLPESVKLLVEAGRAAPSADNMQPWRFSWSQGALSMSYGGARVGNPFFTERDTASQLAMGAAAENVVQAAEAMGLAKDAVIASGGPSPAPYLRVNVDAGSVPPPEVSQRAIFSRHTNRFAYKRDPISQDILTELVRAPQEEADLAIITDDKQRREIAALVRTASRARFRIAHVHEWFMETLRHSAADVDRGDGLDVRTLDLPPGGGMSLKALKSWRVMNFANRFGIYRVLAEVEARPIERGPVIIAIHTNNAANGAFSAGRLMERTWLSLNAQGVAVHPFYVVTDMVERLARDRLLPDSLKRNLSGFDASVRRTLGLANDRRLCMLLRAGSPKVVDPPRARRRPIEMLCDDLG